MSVDRGRVLWRLADSRHANRSDHDPDRLTAGGPRHHRRGGPLRRVRSGRPAARLRAARHRRPGDHRDRRRLGRRPARGDRRAAAGRGQVAASARLARARPRPRAAGLDPAVRDTAGDRRQDRPRHLAVDLPGRHRTATIPPGRCGSASCGEPASAERYWSVRVSRIADTAGRRDDAHREGAGWSQLRATHTMGRPVPTPDKRNACGHGAQAPGDQRRPAEPASGHRPRGNQRVGRVARRSHRRTRRQDEPATLCCACSSGPGSGRSASRR